MRFLRAAPAFALALSACSTLDVVDMPARTQAYREAPICCATFAEMPFEPILALAETREIWLDETSPAFDFGPYGGKSFFRAFELPPPTGRSYEIMLSSYTVTDRVPIAGIQNSFYPFMTFLDADKRPLGATELRHIRYKVAGITEPLESNRLFVSFTVAPDSRVRYIVVHTTRFLIERGGKVPTRSTTVMPIGQGIFIPVDGPVQMSQHPGSPIGRLKIRLEPLKT